MAKETDGTGAPGSAEDQVAGDETQDESQDVWNVEGNLPDDMKPDKKAVPTPKQKQPGEEPPPAKEEGEEEEEPAEEVEEEEPSSEEAQPTEREMELERQVAELTGQMGQFQQMLEYYQGLVNQGVPQQGQQQQPGQPQPQTPVPGQQQPGTETQMQKPPEGILTPGQWDSTDWAKAQEDMGKYFDWHTKSTVQENLQNAYQQAIQPVFQAIGNQLSAIREMVVKAQHKDYDDVIKAVHDELFYLDPNGRPLAEKNPALIKYFQQAPFPELAMYQWGLSKKAPDKIKEAARKGSKETAKKIAAKPKGPTRPKASAPPGEGPALDWDSDEQTVEAELDKAHLI